MCPIRVHWHVKLNYKEYWRVKVTITNFNYRKNYTQWNLVVQHPNFDNLTELFSFNYKSLTPYAGLNDTAMLWGVKFYNDFLSTAGPLGNVQSDILFRKDKSTFTFDKGWAFPRRIYFNGDNCVMPPPDSYPWLPNASSQLIFSLLCTVLVIGIFGCPIVAGIVICLLKGKRLFILLEHSRVSICFRLCKRLRCTMLVKKQSSCYLLGS